MSYVPSLLVEKHLLRNVLLFAEAWLLLTKWLLCLYTICMSTCVYLIKLLLRFPNYIYHNVDNNSGHNNNGSTNQIFQITLSANSK